MDMSGSGTPWLDQPVMLHSSRADTCTLTPEQCAWRHGHWRYWYQSDHVYGLATIYFMCATIGVFTLAHIFSTYAPPRWSRSGISSKIRAVLRYVSYRGIGLGRPRFRWWSYGMGVSLLITAGTVYFFALTLGPKPYYWPNTKHVSYGSSPPIATRTGWMALALLPFVLALSAKANLISAVTGINYEKLQVFHHWTSYAMFVLALIHTFPFIVYHVWKGDMVMQWQTQVTYWTGVPAIIAQAYLTFMSLPWIRNRYYEFFKSTHIFASIIFVVFFFIHCDFRLSSWDYFIAAGCIYFFSLFYAWIRTYLFHGLHTASVQVLPCGLVEIRIPTIISWTPGQHVFLRFLTLGFHSLTAHPFTISSVAHETERCGHPSEMAFYVKPHSGLTARLAALAEKNPNASVRVLLDGPYGGVNTEKLARMDTLLVIAGGSGAGFSLGIVENALRACYQKHTASHPQRVQVIYATRQRSVAQWYAQAIGALFSSTGSGGSSSSSAAEEKNVSASIHITPDASDLSSPSSSDSVTEGDAEKNMAATRSKPTPTGPGNDSTTAVHIQQDQRRPDLKTIIPAATTENKSNSDSGSRSRSIGVVVCGPASMIHDVRNAVAEEQLRVLKNSTHQTEVYLHAEHFSW